MADNAARAAEQAGVAQLVINASGLVPPQPIGVPFVDARHIAPGNRTTGHAAAAALGRALGRPVRWDAISADAVRRPDAAVRQPPGPAPDAGPAREALRWAPRDLETWAREEHRPPARVA